MTKVDDIKVMLYQAKKSTELLSSRFYKTGPGDYAEHDQFIGVSVPELRKIAGQLKDLALQSIQTLLESPINEERLLALLILTDQFQKGDPSIKKAIYQFYCKNLKHVNNWNLVDSSAHYILGAYLQGSEKDCLLTLAQSESLWERRVAIVSTWYFIRNNEYTWTIKLSKVLLHDQHDLIHKAVGWMLREVGKRDKQVLLDFLKENSATMPRTMLRYAIEKLSREERAFYLLRKPYP